MNRTFVLDGDLQRTRFSQWLAAQPLPLQVDVGAVRRRRTNSQNARLWALHQMAARASGYTPEELHEECLCQHYGYSEQERVNPITGVAERKRVPLKRSRARDTVEFRAFLDFVENLYAENLGVWLGQEAA